MTTERAEDLRRRIVRLRWRAVALDALEDQGYPTGTRWHVALQSNAITSEETSEDHTTDAASDDDTSSDNSYADAGLQLNYVRDQLHMHGFGNEPNLPEVPLKARLDEALLALRVAINGRGCDEP